MGETMTAGGKIAPVSPGGAKEPPGPTADVLAAGKGEPPRAEKPDKGVSSPLAGVESEEGRIRDEAGGAPPTCSDQPGTGSTEAETEGTLSSDQPGRGSGPAGEVRLAEDQVR